MKEPNKSNLLLLWLLFYLCNKTKCIIQHLIFFFKSVNSSSTPPSPRVMVVMHSFVRGVKHTSSCFVTCQHRKKYNQNGTKIDFNNIVVDIYKNSNCCLRTCTQVYSVCSAVGLLCVLNCTLCVCCTQLYSVCSVVLSVFCCTQCAQLYSSVCLLYSAVLRVLSYTHL